MNWIHSAVAVIAVFSCCCRGQVDPPPAYDVEPNPFVERQAIMSSTSNPAVKAHESVPDFNKMNDNPPQNSMDLLRQVLLSSPYHSPPYPEEEFPMLRARDHFVSNHFMRRRRREQLHNNMLLTQRRKKALSILSRCCPFWRSSSTSTSTQSASSIPGTGVPGTRAGTRQQGGGLRLQDFENASEFLRATLYGGGHSVRPYSMRLRWGK